VAARLSVAVHRSRMGRRDIIVDAIETTETAAKKTSVSTFEQFLKVTILAVRIVSEAFGPLQRQRPIAKLWPVVQNDRLRQTSAKHENSPPNDGARLNFTTISGRTIFVAVWPKLWIGPRSCAWRFHRALFRDHLTAVG
jgi:hypothetical protein